MRSSMTKGLLILTLMLGLSLSVQAATIEVDGINCLLADAITAANNDVAVVGCDAGSGADVLVLPQNELIVLTEALPEITTEMTIHGNNTTIQRDLNAETFRILTINGGSLQLNDSIISQGDVSHELIGPGPYNTGGGIQVNLGNLEMTRSTVKSNLGGGVLFVNGYGSIVDSVIHDNHALETSSAFGGAGVSVRCSDVTINRTTIHSNYTNSPQGGAGLLQTGTCNKTLTVTNSTISKNVSEFGAAGILSRTFDGRLYLSQVTLTQNICDTSFPHGLDPCGFLSAYTESYVTQSLLSGNINQQMPEEVTDVGGIRTPIAVDQYTVIGLNSDTGTIPETFYAPDGFIVPVNTTIEEILDTNLSLNGGLTPTHKLMLNGPAVDVIPELSCISYTDQTNGVRPLDVTDSGDAKCDVGAFEVRPDLIFENGFDPSAP